MRMLIAFFAICTALPSQQIDRIVAIVDHRPITEGEWEQQERFEALSNKEEWRGIQRSQDALDRLIDRALILKQMELSGVAAADETAVAAQLSSIRQQLKLESDADWKRALHHYGLLEPDVADIVGEQTNLLRFVEIRFRPAVHIAAEDIRRYYRETYAPQFARTAKAGTKTPSLEQVQSQIVTVLAEQRMNDLFATWLKTLRGQANVRQVVKGPR